MNIRCSQLPLLMHCNASVLAPGLGKPDDQSNEARQGDELHRIVTEYAVSHVLPDYETIEDDEVRRLVRNAVGMMEQFGRRGWATGERFAFPLSEWLITGHPDFVSGGLESDPNIIIDLKAGRKHDTDYRPQVRGYAAMFMESADCWILYASDNTAEHWTETPESLAKFRKELLERLTAPARFNYGPHCNAHYCKSRDWCPEYHRDNNSLALALMADTEGVGMGGVPATLLPTFYARLNAVAAAVDNAKDFIKHQVRAAGGRIEGDGYALTIGPDSNIEEINPVAAWETLTANLTIEELASVVRVAKGDTVKAIRAKAPKGKKELAEKDFLQALWDAGAITVTPRAGAIRLEKLIGKDGGK